MTLIDEYCLGVRAEKQYSLLTAEEEVEVKFLRLVNTLTHSLLTGEPCYSTPNENNKENQSLENAGEAYCNNIAN